jgi:hypothetical protein
VTTAGDLVAAPTSPRALSSGRGSDGPHARSVAMRPVGFAVVRTGCGAADVHHSACWRHEVSRSFASMVGRRGHHRHGLVGMAGPAGRQRVPVPGLDLRDVTKDRKMPAREWKSQVPIRDHGRGAVENRMNLEPASSTKFLTVPGGPGSEKSNEILAMCDMPAIEGALHRVIDVTFKGRSIASRARPGSHKHGADPTPPHQPDPCHVRQSLSQGKPKARHHQKLATWDKDDRAPAIGINPRRPDVVARRPGMALASSTNASRLGPS